LERQKNYAIEEKQIDIFVSSSLTSPLQGEVSLIPFFIGQNTQLLFTWNVQQLKAKWFENHCYVSNNL